MAETEQFDARLDLDLLTIGDMEAIEDITGLAFASIEWDKPASTVLLKAMAFVAGRRLNPGFTLEDAANVRFTSAFRKNVAPAESGGAEAPPSPPATSSENGAGAPDPTPSPVADGGA